MFWRHSFYFWRLNFRFWRHTGNFGVRFGRNQNFSSWKLWDVLGNNQVFKKSLRRGVGSIPPQFFNPGQFLISSVIKKKPFPVSVEKITRRNDFEKVSAICRAGRGVAKKVRLCVYFLNWPTRKYGKKSFKKNTSCVSPNWRISYLKKINRWH